MHVHPGPIPLYKCLEAPFKLIRMVPKLTRATTTTAAAMMKNYKIRVGYDLEKQ